MMVPRLRPDPTVAAASPGKSLAIGSRVARRYCVAAHLHSDGAGHAYVAVDERPSSARRLVVLETLPDEPRPSSGAVEAFVRDGRLRERMHHPNVIQTG